MAEEAGIKENWKPLSTCFFVHHLKYGGKKKKR